MFKGFIIGSLLLFSQFGLTAEHMVSIKDFKFSPAQLEVSVGDSVTFVNQDGAPHSVIPRANSSLQFAASGVLQTDDEFSLNIESEDAISAQCGLHLKMPGIEIFVK